MGSKNPLNKFRSRPNFSFRFNPAEEDLLEELTTVTELEDLPSAAAPSNAAAASSLAESKRNSFSEDSLLQLGDDDDNFAMPSGSLSTSSSQSEVTSQTPQSEKSSRDASPLKESSSRESRESRDSRDSQTKPNKRSSSLDYSSDGERWSLSGIKGRIAKRIEEISKDAPFANTLYRGSSFSGEKHVKLKESFSANGVSDKRENNSAEGSPVSKSLTARSRSSLDVRSVDCVDADKEQRSVSVEEGIDCAASDPDPPALPGPALMMKDLEVLGSSLKSSTLNSQNDSSHQSEKRRSSLNEKKAASPKRTGTGLTAKNFLDLVDSVSLSSLKATRSFESELLAADEMEDLSSWEILDSETAIEEKPETPLVFDSRPFNGCTETDSPMPSTLSQQAWNMLTTLPNKNTDFWLKPAVRKWILSIVVALLAVHLAPFSSYCTGLLTGFLISYLLGTALWWLFQPPPPKEVFVLPDYDKLPPLRIPESEDGDMQGSICKGWMNLLPSSISYNPETYNVNCTYSVYVRLEGSQLRLSRPKVNISKRAMWNEQKPNPTFFKQHHLKLLGATVTLPPEGLVKKRLWSKKYPICITILNDSSSLSCLMTQQSVDEDKNNSQPSEKSISDEEKSSSFNSTVVYLFARSCREKEEWHRRFQAAAAGKILNVFSHGDNNSSFCSSSSYPEEKSESSGATEQRSNTPVDNNKDEVETSLLNASTTSNSTSSAAAYNIVFNSVSYASYMAKYVSQENVFNQVTNATISSSSRLSLSSMNESFSGNSISPSDAWLNAIIGRMFYDFLNYPSWSRLVTERIQRKLSVIKVPYFMDELKLRDINLGSNLPVLHRSSPPLIDDRGLWVDFDLTYQGTFQMTLETKLNLMRLKKDFSKELALNVSLDSKSSSAATVNISSATSGGSGVGGSAAVAKVKEEGQGQQSCASDFSPPPTSKSYLYNSDEEDSAESSSDEDLSTAEPLELANEEGSSVPLPTSQSTSAKGSTSKKLLQWVDKITHSRYFQQATEIGFIKKRMEDVSNTPIVLTVEVRGLSGTLALNIPPPPTDRLWYGFRKNPKLSLTARPKLGEHVVTFNQIIDWIEKKLTLEFQKLLVMPNMDDLVIPIMEPGYANAQPKTS